MSWKGWTTSQHAHTQDGKHDRGYFKVLDNTSDVDVYIHAHVDGYWNRTWLQTLNKGRKLVVSREVVGGRVTSFRQKGRNSWSVALFRDGLHVMTTRKNMVPTQLVRVSIGLW